MDINKDHVTIQEIKVIDDCSSTIAFNKYPNPCGLRLPDLNFDPLIIDAYDLKLCVVKQSRSICGNMYLIYAEENEEGEMLVTL